MMIKDRLLSRIFVVILLTLFTFTFSYADSHEIKKEVLEVEKVANQKLSIPVNSHADGNSWTCNENYYRNNAETGCLYVPANAYSKNSSNLWNCNNGYIKSGKSCVEEKILGSSDGADLTNNSESNNSFWIGFFIILLALIAISIIVILALFNIKKKGSFYTLERKIPEEKGDKKPKPSPKPLSKPKEPEVKILNSDIEGNISYQTESIKNLKNDIAVLLKNINDMNQTFMTLKTNLDQKDEEISRYKYGYDATIFKNFLLRFTRVDKVIKEYINDNKIDLNGLKDIQISMNDALAECEVEIFSPDIGADFKTTIGVADNPEIRHTSNKTQDSTIAEILQPGYRRKLPDNSGNEYQIIIEAKVAIYVHKDT